jgi:hypothetical protein
MPTSAGLSETGELATTPGIYVSDCCGYQIHMEEGRLFPPCRKCHDRTFWKGVEKAARAAGQQG